jgi:hypothetical protein
MLNAVDKIDNNYYTHTLFSSDWDGCGIDNDLSSLSFIADIAVAVHNHSIAVIIKLSSISVKS